jgi:hypothetical protein
VIVAAAIAATLAPVSQALVERWQHELYLKAQPAITGVSNRVPFSLLDALILSAAVGLLVLWARRLSRAGTRGWLRAGGAALGWTLVGAAALYLVFLATWGLNYQATPLTRRLDFDASRVDEEAVERLAEVALEQLNGLHGRAHAASWPEGRDLPVTLGPAFAAAQRLVGASRLAVPAPPKPSLLGPYFRRAAVTGMIDPFFLEVLITPDALPFERPAIVAHEWGHLAGFAHEAEASFVGWLTCMHGNGQAKYSGWLDLYPRVVAGLPAATRSRLARRLAAGPRADYAAIERRIREGVVPAMNEAAWAGYDRFLRAHRVQEGAASYDAVVRLVVGTAFEPHWRPRVRAR